MPYVLLDRREPAPIRRSLLARIHSCPRALATQVGWFITEAWGVAAPHWVEQSQEPASMRADVTATGRAGLAATLASRLAGLGRLRFEVLVLATDERMGERFSATPTLGLHRSIIDGAGEVLIPEALLRGLRESRSMDLAEQIAHLLGEEWECELEPYRAVEHLDRMIAGSRGA